MLLSFTLEAGVVGISINSRYAQYGVIDCQWQIKPKKRESNAALPKTSKQKEVLPALATPARIAAFDMYPIYSIPQLPQIRSK